MLGGRTWQIALPFCAALAFVMPRPAPTADTAGTQHAVAPDLNRDGVLERWELAALRIVVFSRTDVDRDGFLTKGDSRGPNGRLKSPPGGRGDAIAWQHMDPDGDEQITLQEFISAPSPLFQKFDRDRNNVLSVSELALFNRAHEF